MGKRVRCSGSRDAGVARSPCMACPSPRAETSWGCRFVSGCGEGDCRPSAGRAQPLPEVLKTQHFPEAIPAILIVAIMVAAHL